MKKSKKEIKNIAEQLVAIAKMSEALVILTASMPEVWKAARKISQALEEVRTVTGERVLMYYADRNPNLKQYGTAWKEALRDRNEAIGEIGKLVRNALASMPGGVEFGTGRQAKGRGAVDPHSIQFFGARQPYETMEAAQARYKSLIRETAAEEQKRYDAALEKLTNDGQGKPLPGIGGEYRFVGFTPEHNHIFSNELTGKQIIINAPAADEIGMAKAFDNIGFLGVDADGNYVFSDGKGATATIHCEPGEPITPDMVKDAVMSLNSLRGVDFNNDAEKPAGILTGDGSAPDILGVATDLNPANQDGGDWVLKFDVLYLNSAAPGVDGVYARSKAKEFPTEQAAAEFKEKELKNSLLNWIPVYSPSIGRGSYNESKIEPAPPLDVNPEKFAERERKVKPSPPMEPRNKTAEAMKDATPPADNLPPSDPNDYDLPF